MKIGVVYPQTELNGDPVALDQFARATEKLGYQHLLLYDHVVGAVHQNRDPQRWWKHGPYNDTHPFHDPLVAFGYLAGITEKIELLTGILILPQRQTVLVAKQAAEVDLLSGGRLGLGVGIGWNYVEYDALGQDFRTRGKRLTEQMRFLRKLWEEPLVTFEGQFDRIDRGNILPRPKRRIPLYCGGFSPPALERAATLADGFIFGAGIDSVLPMWQQTQGLLREKGQPVEGFDAHYLLQTKTTAGLGADQAVDAARRWQDAGGTRISVVTMGQGMTGVNQHIDFIDKLKDRLG